jgi:hypothetical protein
MSERPEALDALFAEAAAILAARRQFNAYWRAIGAPEAEILERTQRLEARLDRSKETLRRLRKGQDG